MAQTESKVGMNDLPAVSCPVCTARHLPTGGAVLKNGVYAATCQNCGFFFKFSAKQAASASVTFSVNGTKYTVGNEYDPATSLNEYLRRTGVSRGTKQMCIEGGCGICLVTATLYNPLAQSSATYSVNSCLVQLYMCDGWEITTIEGLGNTRVGLHPIQARLAQYNGSQCGFCSPAQVMNMHGLLQKTPSPTMKEVEDHFDATICRCTGYRSILDAMKSFCEDAPPSLPGGLIDIEDTDKNLCRKSGKPCTGQCHSRSSNIMSPAGDGCEDAEESGSPRPLHIVSARAQWFKPTSKSDLYNLLKQHKDNKYRLVFGNSGFGVYKDLGPWRYDVLIDMRGITQLYTVTISKAGEMSIGANVSLTNLLELSENNAQKSEYPYFAPFARHLKLVATQSIRNIACWAGSLMLKHKHPDFVSDIFTILDTAGALLLIGSSDGSEKVYNLADFLDLDMRGKVIIATVLPKCTDDITHISTFRVSQRLQNCHGYVTAGFNFKVDADKKFTVKGPPRLVFQGISSKLNRATKTESFLNGKQLGNPDVLKGALDLLGKELTPDSQPVLASPSYRRTLAQALFYKFVLQVCSPVIDPRYLSGTTDLQRPVSSGVQTYGTHKEEWPLTEPMTKRDAIYQTCGEVRFLDDESLLPEEVFGAFVISDVGNAHIDTVDISAAMKMPGVLKYICAADFPVGGENNFMPGSSAKEEIFSTGEILFAGQAIGLIVAKDAITADTAASMVKVTYKDVKPPLLNLREAVKQKSFFSDVVPDPLVKGDPDDAIAKSPHRISGSIECGSQYHFQMETQTARCVPGDDGGMFVQATTQWIDGTEEVVSKVLNVPQNCVTVEVKRLGGAFGSKITRNFQVSGACALAAYVMQRPVRLRMDIHSNLKSLGKRFPFLADYEAGFTKDGMLNGVSIRFYGDFGSSTNDSSVPFMYTWLDNAYFCENWKFTPYAVMTNTPSNTYCRAPGSVPAQFIMESIMEHGAKSVKMDPTQLRMANLYEKGQTSANGMKLDYCSIRPIVQQLRLTSEFDSRQKQVQEFNQANRWKKKGISLVPTRFGLIWAGGNFGVYVAIYHADGTIAIQHGGIEVGQGINLKVSQVCAYELNVPLSLIRVKKGSSIGNANSATTGGSITSELNALGVKRCCEILRSRMTPVREKLGSPSWQDLVKKCYEEGIDLCARFFTDPTDRYDSHYNVYGAAVAEAEIDVLTGQSQLSRVDILYDCGESLNPEIDIGQVEGGFVHGLGYHLTEKIKYDPQTGAALTAGTWEYKPPMPKDLPIDFRLALLKDAPNPQGVLRSKASGEPPLVLATSALFAIKHAAEAARAEIQEDNFFPLNSPALVEDVQAACLVAPSQFVLK